MDIMSIASQNSEHLKLNCLSKLLKPSLTKGSACLRLSKNLKKQLF